MRVVIRDIPFGVLKSGIFNDIKRQDIQPYNPTILRV